LRRKERRGGKKSKVQRPNAKVQSPKLKAKSQTPKPKVIGPKFKVTGSNWRARKPAGNKLEAECRGRGFNIAAGGKKAGRIPHKAEY